MNDVFKLLTSSGALMVLFICFMIVCVSIILGFWIEKRSNKRYSALVVSVWSVALLMSLFIGVTYFMDYRGSHLMRDTSNVKIIEMPRNEMGIQDLFVSSDLVSAKPSSLKTITVKGLNYVDAYNMIEVYDKDKKSMFWSPCKEGDQFKEGKIACLKVDPDEQIYLLLKGKVAADLFEYQIQMEDGDHTDFVISLD